MGFVSCGARQLRQALERWSQRALARQLGVTQQAVFAWQTGRNCPSPRYMARLEDLLEIPMRAWTEPAADEVTQ